MQELAPRTVQDFIALTGVLEALSSAIMVFDEGTLTYANKAAIALFAIPADAFSTDQNPGAKPKAVFGKEYRPVVQSVKEATALGKTVSIHIEMGGRTYQCDSSPVLQEHDKTVGIAVIMTDVTEAHNMMAMRRDFVANVSHELKTPVTGIQALAESLALALEHDPQRAQTMVGRIEAEADRLTKLVRELLDLTRYEEGHTATMERVRLVSVVLDQVSRLQALANAKHVRITVDVPGDVYLLTALPALKLIIGNLLANAVMYNKEQGFVTIHASRTQTMVTLTVTDSGIGIAPQQQSRIFERFYRVDRARSRAVGGTGLGLSLVRHAVEQLQGSITVDSVVDHGTTMTVQLPVDGGLE